MLAMKWNNQVCIDTRLPFGLRSAPKLFNILADLLSWILESKGVSPILHYLDDFLTMGPPSSTTCEENLNIINEVFSYLGLRDTISLFWVLSLTLAEDKLSRIHAQLAI